MYTCQMLENERKEERKKNVIKWNEREKNIRIF